MSNGVNYNQLSIQGPNAPWNPISSYAGAAQAVDMKNAMMENQAIRERETQVRDLMSQVPAGAPIPPDIFQQIAALDPAGAAQIQQGMFEQAQAQRADEFRQAAGPWIEAHASGQPFDTTAIYEAFPQQAMALESEMFMGDITEASKTYEMMSLRAAQASMVADALGIANTNDEWEGALDRMQMLGMDVTPHRGKFSEAYRDQLVKESVGAKALFIRNAKLTEPLAFVGKTERDLRNLLREGHITQEQYDTGMQNAVDNIGKSGQINMGDQLQKPFLQAAPAALKASAELARGASDTLIATNELKGLMEGELFMGAGSDVKLIASKLLRMIGAHVDVEKIKNSEAARAMLITMALPVLKNFPGQLSEKEMEAAFSSIGTAKEEPEKIQYIISVAERNAERVLRDHIADVKHYSDQGISIPPSYDIEYPTFQKDIPLPPAENYPEGEVLVNEETGERVQKINGAWQPVK